MAKQSGLVEIKEKVPADKWIGRLSSVLMTMEEMQQDERQAVLAFLKSKYRADWPSDNY